MSFEEGLGSGLGSQTQHVEGQGSGPSLVQEIPAFPGECVDFHGYGRTLTLIVIPKWVGWAPLGSHFEWRLVTSQHRPIGRPDDQIL